MIITCVHIHVKPDHVDQFIQATVQNHKGTIKEPGNLRFDLLQQADDPSRFMIYEVFDTEDDVKAHKDTAHYLKWRDSVGEWMAEPRTGIRYRVIEPKNKEEW
jgi:autoinducer 2-degrading protein